MGRYASIDYLCLILVLPVGPGSEKGTLSEPGTVPAAVKPVPPVGGSLQPEFPPLFACKADGKARRVGMSQKTCQMFPVKRSFREQK